MSKRAFMHIYHRNGRAHRETEAFGVGLERHGWLVEYGDTVDFHGRYDLIVQWNVRLDGLIDRVLADGGESAVLETSYLEPRKAYCSVGFGKGVNNWLRHYGPFTDSSRFRERFISQLRPWKPYNPEGYVLIMGQVPYDQSIRCLTDFFTWVYGQYCILTERGEEVIFRPHPRFELPAKTRAHKYAKVCFHENDTNVWLGLENCRDAGMKIQDTQISLEKALAGAKQVVTFNSNSGVDAVMAGVPAVTMDKGAMAWDVTSHDLDTVLMPDRGAWASALAWMQYGLEEFRNGFCWEAVCPPHLR